MKFPLPAAAALHGAAQVLIHTAARCGGIAPTVGLPTADLRLPEERRR